ncbi:MAG: PfkB family carbohydrate kinase [Eubacteriales bacterium]|nr:PfkB family carbohydrate kinase [Eubacteriales bacterium]
MYNRVLLIGGINLDICGSPESGFRLHDSNIGSVSVSAGGVGRNIAHNLRLLGTDVTMITAFGKDMFSGLLKENLSSLGIDYSMSAESEKYSTSVYLYVTDEAGDMHVAINDMGVVSCITPEHLKQHAEKISCYPAIVIDANLPQETIEYLADNFTMPIYADAVSAAKVKKLENVLGKIYCLKLNQLEAETLTGESAPVRAAKALYAAGVKRPFISAGKDGIITFDGKEIISVPAEKAECINTTGAGDAATAALVYAGIHGYSPKNSAVLAVKAGAAAVRVKETVNPLIVEILSDSGKKYT